MIKIALCGFMGCGKTTVSKSLEKLLSIPFIDTDKYIEDKENTSINLMFEKYSESYFRDKEYEALCTLSKKDDTILSLGGGAVMYERNVKVLKENGYIIVFIDTDFEEIKNRLLNDKSRPLLKQNDISALYQKRLPIYNNVCDIKIECKSESSDTIAQLIKEKIKKEYL